MNDQGRKTIADAGWEMIIRRVVPSAEWVKLYDESQHHPTFPYYIAVYKP